MRSLIRKVCVIEDNTASIAARDRRPITLVQNNYVTNDNRQVHIAGEMSALAGGGFYKGRQVIELPGGAA